MTNRISISPENKSRRNKGEGKAEVKTPPRAITSSFFILIFYSQKVISPVSFGGRIETAGRSIHGEDFAQKSTKITKIPNQPFSDVRCASTSAFPPIPSTQLCAARIA